MITLIVLVIVLPLLWFALLALGLIIIQVAAYLVESVKSLFIPDFRGSSFRCTPGTDSPRENE